jgi:ubiquinone/menaquinone biosynthesis C-methylase UbiE
METATQQDIGDLKAALTAVWNAGDYGFIAEGLRDSAQAFLDRLGIEAGERLLDVACGTGQLTIPAAGLGAEATGLDISENWIAQARRNAEAAGVGVRFDLADAEEMPYADGAFDTLTSMIGVMFAPRPERATAEMLRVVRPGGRIALANWTAEGMVGEFFRIVAGYAPPPEMPSPLLWGDEATVERRFGSAVTDLQMNRRMLRFDYDMMPDPLVDHYLEHFGPTKMAAAALDDSGRAALKRDLVELWDRRNTASDGGTEVDAEVLEVVAVKAG